ncbi:uncharacterized protein SPAPADRAFT_61013 [Spathaspora passalidarum NRRL Y-27907]|uniref:Anaphase-promoting complex subunit 4 n=1 Tax=Spathaspora passalidarum (strain NRRL Y-27907 / 11-Y1) TaxID=619300 RepID=G3AN64_SPAPN|nr:uncharacterized protein SPAPADRAFT_61013 [Spathaspora passalidarum NRRL Y-27907]EGW31907.1 hypothetical protein SPAPADRAFT_61013 [Spathaspora passalidarum NRRL Y-27907]
MTQSLSVIHSGKFVSLSDGNILTFCPSLNLLFISMNKTSLWIYRTNGERIYSINNKTPIQSICFNQDWFVCVGLDSSIKIYDCDDGKLLQTHTSENVKLIQWTSLQQLSEQLYNVDVLGQMPKLPLVENSSLDYMIVGDDHSVNITFNNLTNETQLNTSISLPDGWIPVLPPQGELFKELMFLIRRDNSHRLLCLSYNLENKTLFQTVLVKLSHSINLLHFIQKNLQDCHKHIESSFQILDRLFDNLQTEIEEPLTVHLINIALTNLIDESTKDYWLNSMGERNYKRLSKAMNHMYDEVRQVMFKFVITSFERLIILLSDLKGITIWLNDTEEQDFGLNLNIIEELISMSTSWIKTSYRLIFDIQKEQKLFNEFMAWVKGSIIDKISEEESTDQDFSICDIIKFINNLLLTSSLGKYFELCDYSILKFKSDINLLHDIKQISGKFKLLTSSVNNFHRSVIHFEETIQVELPPSHYNLTLQQAQGEWLLCYMESSSLGIKNLTHNKTHMLTNIKSYQYNNNCIFALSDELIVLDIDFNQTSIEIPPLTFVPDKLIVTNDYCLFADSDRNYSICLNKS